MRSFFLVWYDVGQALSMSITFARVMTYLSLRAVNRSARSELRSRKSAQIRYESFAPFDHNRRPENVSVNVLS